MRFKTRQLEENACNLYPAKRSPMRCFIGGKTVHKKWKHLLNSSHKGIKKMHASQCGDSDTSRNKMESVWRWFQLLLSCKRKDTEVKQNLTSNLGFCSTSQCQSKTSCWPATFLRNGKLTLVRIWLGTRDQFVAECSSYKNYLHQQAPSECCRLSSEEGETARESAQQNLTWCIQWEKDVRVRTKPVIYWQVSEGWLRNFQKLGENLKDYLSGDKNKTVPAGGGEGERKYL